METKNHAQPKRSQSISLRCPGCNGVTETFWSNQGYQFGEGESAVEIDVSIPVHRCVQCALEFLDDEGQRLKHEALCAHFGVLTPREIRDIRRRHGMTRAEFAKISGLGEASLGRWEKGTVIQNYGNDRYLRLLAAPNGIEQLITVLQNVADEKRDQASSGAESTHQRFKFLSNLEETKREEQAFDLRGRKAA